VREAAGGEGARDTESKTRTPHKDVGNQNRGIATVKCFTFTNKSSKSWEQVAV
jgi:hypothetical protein